MDDDRRRIVLWAINQGEVLSGRFMEFMALSDIYGFIKPHALVEMNDGRVRILNLNPVNDFRFFIPGGEDDR